MRIKSTWLLALSVAALLRGGAIECVAFERNISGAASARFAAVANSPLFLRAFLSQMPKGADLHNHLTGGSYAEHLIQAGIARGICIQVETLAAAPPPCDASQKLRALSDAATDADLNRKIVNAWSMRSFVPEHGTSGHDHFFGTFALFSAAADLGALAAAASNRAAIEKLLYMEFMISLQGRQVRDLANKVQWTDDLAAMRARLDEAGVTGLVKDARSDLDAIEAERYKLQKCEAAGRAPGCDVQVRYLVQITRTGPPGAVFAQALFGFLLAKEDSRVAGVDLVGAEDHPVALRDYTLQMEMLDFLSRAVPGVNVSLHAGELTLGLVPPEDLRFHIAQAVTKGKARRIGHGVDIMYEENPHELLRQMAANRIAVEICLTSNAQILGVSGENHPFIAYRAFKVPVVLSTDDEGVERTDMTSELQRAVTAYKLSYADLVTLQRNSLEYAFLPGASLWADPKAWKPVKECANANPGKDPPARCAEFLQGSEKARLQWRLEKELHLFNVEAASMTP